MRVGGRLFLLSVFQEIQKCDDTADSRTDGAKKQDSLLNDIPHPRSPPSVFAKEGFCYSRRLSTTLSRSGGIDRQHIQGVSASALAPFYYTAIDLFCQVYAERN